MTDDYRVLAAAELAKIRDANDALRARAAELRGRGAEADTRADGLTAEADAASFRLAGAYTALAALGPPPAETPEEAP